jgi:hypothetical protein
VYKHRVDVVYAAATSGTVSGDEFLANRDGEVSGPYTRPYCRLVPKVWAIVASTPAEAQWCGLHLNRARTIVMRI